MDEHILERVRRLLAIAHDTAASPNEQTVALERAQKLIDRHAIEQWELERDDPSRREPVTERFIPLNPSPVNGLTSGADGIPYCANCAAASDLASASASSFVTERLSCLMKCFWR